MQTTSPRSTAAGVYARLDSFHKAKMAFLIAGGLSSILSVTLWFTGSRQEALFVGLRVPAIHSLGSLVLAADDGEPLRSTGRFWLDRRPRAIPACPRLVAVAPRPSGSGCGTGASSAAASTRGVRPLAPCRRRGPDLAERRWAERRISSSRPTHPDRDRVFRP